MRRPACENEANRYFVFCSRDETVDGRVCRLDRTRRKYGVVMKGRRDKIVWYSGSFALKAKVLVRSRLA